MLANGDSDKTGTEAAALLLSKRICSRQSSASQRIATFQVHTSVQSIRRARKRRSQRHSAIRRFEPGREPEETQATTKGVSHPRQSEDIGVLSSAGAWAGTAQEEQNHTSRSAVQGTGSEECQFCLVLISVNSCEVRSAVERR